MKLPLSVTHPELSSEAVNWDPAEYTSGSNMKKTWRCSLGHLYETRICDRALSNTNCPYCCGQKILTGFNDLKTTHPKIAAEAFGWNSTEVSANSAKKLTWKCYKGHIWESRVYVRTRGSGCVYCSNQKLLKGFNDLATTHPEIAQEAYGWDPSQYIFGSGIRVLWKCKKEHIWQASIRHRTRPNRPSGCNVCSGKIVLGGYNDLATTHPEIAQEAYGWDPTKVSSGISTSLEWQCQKGHIWKTSPGNRTNPKNGSNCPSCETYGYDPSEPGFIYFMKQATGTRLQIGITNTPQIRLRTHESNGWNLIEVLGPIDGLLASNWEKSILKMLRHNKIKMYGKRRKNETHSAKDFRGESWDSSEFSPQSISELMNLARDF